MFTYISYIYFLYKKFFPGLIVILIRVHRRSILSEIYFQARLFEESFVNLNKSSIWFHPTEYAYRKFKIFDLSIKRHTFVMNIMKFIIEVY